MNKTEAIRIKLLVRDYFKGHRIPDEVKKGTNSEVAEWFSSLVEKLIADKEMVK